MNLKHVLHISSAARLAAALATLVPLAAHADDPVQTLHAVSDKDYDPTPGMIIGHDGNFYGATEGYGAVNGTVFSLSADAKTYTTIYPFSGGEKLIAGVTEGPDGSLYGTIYSGSTTLMSGSVFKVTKTGVFTTLHTFMGPDGANPVGPVVVAADGTIYGTTYNGGDGVGTGSGTVFTIDPTGAFSTYYDFADDDVTVVGKNPRSRMVLTQDGSLYGTTTTGGTADGGTIFRIPPGNAAVQAVSLDTTIGTAPHDLLKACDGNFYGRALSGNGVIFRMNAVTGGLVVLHALSTDEGNFAYGTTVNVTGGALAEGSNHLIYGVAQYGGASGGGLIFSVGLDGTFATVASQGLGEPWGVLQGNDGNLYGTFPGGIYGATLPAAERATTGCPVGTTTSGTGGSNGGAAGASGAAGAAGTGTAGTGDTGAGGAVGTAGTSGSGAAGTSGSGAAGTSGSGAAGSDAAATAGRSGGEAGTTGGQTSSGKSGGCSIAGGARTRGSLAFAALALLVARRRRSRR